MQGRINHGAKRAMAQGPQPWGGPPRHQELEKNNLLLAFMIYVPVPYEIPV